MPNLPQLTSLDLHDNALTAAPPAAGMPLLESLVLDGNPLEELTALGAHPSLTKLSVRDGHLEALGALEDTPPAALDELEAAVNRRTPRGGGSQRVGVGQGTGPSHRAWAGA